MQTWKPGAGLISGDANPSVERLVTTVYKLQALLILLPHATLSATSATSAATAAAIYAEAPCMPGQSLEECHFAADHSSKARPSPCRPHLLFKDQGTPGTLPWSHESQGPFAGLPPAQAHGCSGEGLQMLTAGTAASRQHVHAGLILYRVYVVPALLYALPETGGFTAQKLQPLVSAHDAYMRRVTGMGRRPDGTLHPTAQICAAAGMPLLMQILKATMLTCLGHVARMPDGSVDQHL
eukprot:347308-Chlamydomonas_euryale.AAC.1